MRPYLAIFAVGAALGVGIWVGKASAPRDTIARETIPMPMLLKQVQAMGELHSAAYSYENIYTHQTYVRPQGALASLPGADQVARATTANSALVAADGTVEAGVDLAQARIERNRIVLPKARMYEPQVHAKLHQVRRGLFWRDEGLAYGALNDAKERMAGAAREGGILAEAEKNAIAQVQRIVGNGVQVEVQG